MKIDFFSLEQFNFQEGLISLRKLCYEYLSSKDKDELYKNILASFSYFYRDKSCFKDLAEFFSDEGLEEFKVRAENVYCGFKAVELRDMIGKLDKERSLQLYNATEEIFGTAKYGKIFNHYIKVHALKFSVLDDNHLESEVDNVLRARLEKIDWSWKYNIYKNKIKKIIKLNSEKTKSSVIVISNNASDEIIEGLKQIYSQKINKDNYKIIFVSNNDKNESQEIIKLVDTFISMKDNDGAYIARNVGSIFAASDVLIFLEDDGVPCENFVRAHENLHRANITAARGACLTKSNGMMPNWYWLGNKIRFCPTNMEGNCSFDAKRFYEVGGWGDYVFFGHGGYEICHRMLQMNSSPEMHLYSPDPVIYHDFYTMNKKLDNKKLAQHASWQVLKFSYVDFHKITSKWSPIS